LTVTVLPALLVPKVNEGMNTRFVTDRLVIAVIAAPPVKVLFTSEKNQPLRWLDVLSQIRLFSKMKLIVLAVVMVYELEIEINVSLEDVELDPWYRDTWKVEDAATVTRPTTRTLN